MKEDSQGSGGRGMEPPLLPSHSSAHPGAKARCKGALGSWWHGIGTRSTLSPHPV